MTGPFIVPLPYDRPPLSMNKRLHHMAEYRVREQIRTDVLALARFYKLPKGLERVHVVLHWSPIVRRTRDTDNPGPTVKAILDALKPGTPKKPGHGLVPDDDSEHVSSEVVIHPVRPFRHTRRRIVYCHTHPSTPEAPVGTKPERHPRRPVRRGKRRTHGLQRHSRGHPPFRRGNRQLAA
jgi:hypothetical protein